MKKALTATQVAEISQIGKRTVHSHAASGLIPSFKIRAALRFDPQQLAKWLREKID
jgi:nucleotidyltransferase/DNA polymerase involved in DNA repair